MIEQQRQESSSVLVLDAGDGWIGDQSPATTSQGKSSVELMNLMGYDAMALGEGDLRLLGLDVIQQRMREAQFSVLSANAVLTGTDELLVEPYVIRQVGGHRIAIIGLSGAATLPEAEIRDPLGSAREVVDQLQGQADILILLSHAGLSTNQQIAAEIPEIDLIVGGGGRGYTSVPQLTDGGPPIVHADVASPGHTGRKVGVGTWWFDEGGGLIEQEWRSVSLGPEIPDAPDIAAWALANP